MAQDQKTHHMHKSLAFKSIVRRTDAPSQTTQPHQKRALRIIHVLGGGCCEHKHWRTMSSGQSPAYRDQTRTTGRERRQNQGRLKGTRHAIHQSVTSYTSMSIFPPLLLLSISRPTNNTHREKRHGSESHAQPVICVIPHVSQLQGSRRQAAGQGVLHLPCPSLIR